MVNYLEKVKRIKNPYLIFLPFLFFYFFLVLKSPTHGNFGDEGRYVTFAENIINGFYSTPYPGINLWNGPGYPILLIPFVFFKLPLVSITLFNAVLYYISVVLLFKTLQKFVSFKITLITSLFWACYINSYGEMKVIFCEVVTSFLICLLLFCVSRSFNGEKASKRYAVFSGLTIGYIVLTKVIFGYVALVLFFALGLLWLLNSKSFNIKRGVLIMGISLVTIAPYIIYTYSLTGKVYYLSNSGGMSLYWMSATDENELGDWFSERSIRQDTTLHTKIDQDNTMPGFNNYLYKNHIKDYQEINKYVGVERDEAYKRIAINNIKNYPVKYLKNCISNIERLLFSFPYSYTLEHTIMQVAVNGPLVLCMLFSLMVTLVNWRKIPFFLRLILFFVFMYLGVTILVSTYTRMFTVIVPVILFWIAFTFNKSIELRLNFEKQL